jgi:tetratricopeptide (TPR) repeat protein
MEKRTYSDSTVVEFSNQTFVNVEISLEDRDPTIKRFDVSAIPVTFLVTPQGEPAASWLGFIGPLEYVQYLKKAVSAHTRIKEILPKLKAQPEDYALNREAGDCYADLGEGRKAADAYKKSIARAPDAASKGDLLNKTIEALSLLEEAVEEKVQAAQELDRIDPDGALGYKDNAAIVFAMEAARRDKLEESIGIFETILKRWPGSDKAEVALAWLASLYFQARKDVPKAEATIATLLQKYPKSMMMEQVKELQEAIKNSKR